MELRRVVEAQGTQLSEALRSQAGGPHPGQSEAECAWSAWSAWSARTPRRS